MQINEHQTKFETRQNNNLTNEMKKKTNNKFKSQSKLKCTEKPKQCYSTQTLMLGEFLFSVHVDIEIEVHFQI